MTIEEFSNGFDLILNSYSRFKDFDSRENLDSIELNEFEKSFFLTKAQEEIVESFYNGRNVLGESFEETEQLRRMLSNLIVEDNLTSIGENKPIGMGDNSYFFTLPNDVWFITYEAATISNSGSCNDGATIDVIPVTQDEYHKIKRNPFRGTTSRRALRLDLADDVVEIVSKYAISSYYIRYVRKLKPIVLENLPNRLTVNEEGNESPCELHEGLHQRILDRAVQLALQSKGYTTRKNNNDNR